MPYSEPRSPLEFSLTLDSTADLPPLPDSPELQQLWQETLGWSPDEAQRQQFQRLYHLILQGNQVLNLTRITEPEDFWEKHLWDSLSGIRSWLTQSEDRPAIPPPDPVQEAHGEVPAESPLDVPKTPLDVIDIGTGAGFPGLPVAIARPDWRVTLLDATRKKIAFVEAALPLLELPNVRTLTHRVESIGRVPAHRESYDLALLRAVAPVSVCLEYALPLLRLGGWAVLYRGHWTEAETEAMLPAATKLGGELATIDPLQTPMSGGDRHCILVKKVAPTPPEFPRTVGVAAQKPL